MDLDDRMYVEDTARHWWIFLLGGIAWLLISWVVLRMNATSIVAVGVLLGVVFLFAGINEIGMAGVWRRAAGRCGTSSWRSSS